MNASVLLPLTIFTITLPTGLFCKPVTRPVTRICADADAANTTNTTVARRILFILLDVIHKLSLIIHKLLINYFVLS